MSKLANSPVIVEAAINGETRPERNPNVPRNPEEIIADVFRCLDAGASMIHAHNDAIRKTGRKAAEAYLLGGPPVPSRAPTPTRAPRVRGRLGR